MRVNVSDDALPKLQKSDKLSSSSINYYYSDFKMSIYTPHIKTTINLLKCVATRSCIVSCASFLLLYPFIISNIRSSPYFFSYTGVNPKKKKKTLSANEKQKTH